MKTKQQTLFFFQQQNNNSKKTLDNLTAGNLVPEVTSGGGLIESGSLSASVSVLGIVTSGLLHTEVEGGAVGRVPEVSVSSAPESHARVDCGLGLCRGGWLVGVGCWWGWSDHSSIQLVEDGRQEGVFLVKALATEIVGFEGPNHAAAELFLDEVVDL